MNRIAIASFIVIVIAGCTATRIETLQSDERLAEQAYAATTQATAAARETLSTMPTNAPGRAKAVGAISNAEKIEQTARLALDLAQTALSAAQHNNADDPALKQSLSAAINAIPSPWTPVLASLLPAAIPLVVSVMQSVKLGQAHQTVANVTQQLEAHKAALEAMNVKASASDAVVGLPL
jgi:hypothetical protein